MPKKRLRKRKTTITSKISRKKLSKSKRGIDTKGKVDIILKNLILFGVLFVLSSILYRLSSTDEVFSNFFGILAILTGVVLMAFVIAYFVFFFIKLFKK